ncbi:BRD4-interacting chromatin-remodeling complex-associated protein [Trichomycterus rosablanca]|uniref:BRD4-interacting chromatin-remodeling complex-associated protein n=1 Tax=Trichomycterus rosablanca TaxID=2290929 RepID=UPI002F34F8F3
MDDEDGRCLLDVICDPQALNDFLHGSETQGHVPEVQPPAQLSTSEPSGLPRVSVDLDFLEDDDILGGSPGGGDSERNGVGSNHEPCDILQQSLAEANITEQSLQEAEAELDLSSFGLTSLTQVVQPLPDASLPGVSIGGNAPVFSGQGTTTTPSSATTDMLSSVLTHPGLQLQSQVMNKAINVQPFMQQVGLGNVTLQPISGLQTIQNGSQSSHLGIGQIQVVGQPTVMTINPSGQQILTKTMGGYQLHQPGLDAASSGTQAGLGGSVLSSGGGLLIQGGKTTLNGPAVSVSSTSANSSVTTMAAPSGIVGFTRAPLSTGIASQPQPQSQIMQNVVIQRTPTPIQPKPPQGGTIQPKIFKQQQQQLPASHPLQSDANKALGVQQVPAAAAQNVAFLTGKPSSNVVLSAQTTTQGAQFPQTLFKPHVTPTPGKPLSVHLLNQQGSIVIPSQAVLQGQNHQFLLPQLQTGGQILTQQPGGHIIASSGPGQIIAANQILTTNQNINLGQVLASQGHHAAAHIVSGSIQLQHGQMGHPTLFQMPVSLAQSQNQSSPVTGHVQTVIQGMPIQNSLSIESLSPAVSLQPTLQPQAGGIPGNNSSGVAAMAQCQPGENMTVLGSSTEQAAQSQTMSQSSILTVQTSPSISAGISVSSSTPPISTVTTTTPSVSTVGLATQVQQSPGKVLFTHHGSSIILSPESVQMFLQQVSSSGHQQAQKIQSPSPSQPMATRSATPTLSDSPQPSQASPLMLGHQIQSPHHPQSRPPSQPQAQPPSQPQASSRACTPSSIPPLFIIHNQLGGSPQPPQSTAQTLQTQITQVLPQPVTLQQEQPRSSSSPKPQQPPPTQFHFATPTVSAAAVVKHQGPGLTSEQQHQLQLISAQLQTMSAIAQPSQQQKQLLEKLNQVQQNILLQSKDVQAQPPAISHYSKLSEQPIAQVVTSASTTVPSLLQQKSVLVKSSATSSNETQVFSATLGPSEVTVNQVKTTPNLAQAVQANPGVVSSVGGLTMSKQGLQIPVLGSRLSQMPPLQPPTPLKNQSTTLKRPFIMEPSKEARMLEQLRKLQGSVLHPDYSSPFCSFEDTLCRLLPYHLYQGVAPSPQDYHKVDDEFQNISSQLLKRTQAMLDKYRHLLFEESRRLGPSAEMVMIDRMFIQEEKVVLNQDRILAKEKPEEFVANSCLLNRAVDSGVRPAAVEPTPVRTTMAPTHIHTTSAPATVTAASTSTPAPAPFPPTKLVIKQGGGGALVSWSTSSTSTPAVTRPCKNSERCSSQTPSSTHSADDDDALPQRTSKPPIKTYEARQRIGLKLKIKQEAGFSKVVHNTALDPVHLQAQNTLSQTPEASPKSRPTESQSVTVIRTSSPTCNSISANTYSAVTTQANFTSSGSSSSTVPHSSSSLSWSSFSSSCTSSAQMNGSLEHFEVSGAKLNSTSTVTPQTTTCRLPLRKTYRENISPCHRPGVPGGGDLVSIPPMSSPEPPAASSPKPERTVIASVKLEQQDCSKPTHTYTDPEATTEDRFCYGIKNVHHHQQQQQSSDKEDGEDGNSGDHVHRVMWQTSKNQERAMGMFCMDQHAPGPPSPGETSWTRDSSLPAKRCKSDSPDMDNASFSSGSPPLDNSLNEHLQSAIDSILNLQQALPSRGAVGKVSAGNPPNRHQTHHRQSTQSSSTTYRHTITPNLSSSSSSISQQPQLGGRGQNGSLVSQTHSR